MPIPSPLKGKTRTSRRSNSLGTVTLADVARHVGMSNGTVSRVLNGAPKNVPIRPQTRSRVQQAAKELGYTANATARALANGRTNTIGVFCYDIADPLIPCFLDAVEAQAQCKGYRLLIGTTFHAPLGEVADGDACISLMHERRVDAILVLGERIIEAEGYLANCPGVTLAVAAGIGPNGKVCSANIDYFNAGVEAGVYLASLGHRKVAFMAGSNPSESVHRRCAGIRAGLAKHGAKLITLSDDLSLSPEEAGRKCIASLLADHPDVTAAVARKDRMALGALRALQESGVRVPDQFSLMNWGDAPFCSLTYPALTSVTIPMREVGERMMANLIELLTNTAATPTHITLPMQLVVRESTGPARKNRLQNATEAVK